MCSLSFSQTPALDHEPATCNCTQWKNLFHFQVMPLFYYSDFTIRHGTKLRSDPPTYRVYRLYNKIVPINVLRIAWILPLSLLVITTSLIYSLKYSFNGLYQILCLDPLTLISIATLGFVNCYYNDGQKSSDFLVKHIASLIDVVKWTQCILSNYN